MVSSEPLELKYPTKFRASKRPNWCPGCGDHALLSATIKGLEARGFLPHETVIVSGIGCSSSFPHWTTAYGIHSIHGRALPAALGAHLANTDLKVIAVGGDGDGYGIGVGHFVHACRRNADILYMVMNNQIYGLTLGQASPSSQLGHVTTTTPHGVDEPPVNPIALALGAGATFVARGFSGDAKHLQQIIEQALDHKGFAFIDVLSPCVSFNKLNTYDWFRERVYKLEDEGHDPHDKGKAFVKAQEWGDKIPIGVFFKTTQPSYKERNIVTRKMNPIKQPLSLTELGVNINKIYDEFR